MQILNSTDLYNPPSDSFSDRKFTDNQPRFLSSHSQRSENISSVKQHQGSDGFQVFQSTLSKSYQKFSTHTVVPVSESHEQKLSAETVANNILSFIEQRLRKDYKEGASPEELEKRLDEGLEGFKKGFAEAKEKIEALGMLNPEIEENIGKTYELVIDGIDDLRAHLLEGKEQSTSNDNQPVADSDHEQIAALSASYGHVSFAQSNTMNFEVETADGDVVTISAKSKDVYAAEYRAGSYATANRTGGFEEFSSESFQSSRFEMSVVGELDENEMRALDQLMGKVEDLSSDFFAGDLDSAFNQALNLGYDSNEIVGYSLNLRQVEVQRVAVAYQQIGPANTSAINPLADQLQPIGDFAKNLLDAIDLGSTFADSSRLIADLSEQIDLSNPPVNGENGNQNRFGHFVKDLLDVLPNHTDA